MLRVVLADDHQMFTEGVAQLFATTSDMDLVAIVENGDDLLIAIDECRPDVAIVDISMPGPGLPAIIERVHESGVPCGLVALTMHLEAAFARDLLARGLAGYVLKDAAFREVQIAVRAVAKGNTYLSERVSDMVTADDPERDALTQREMDCLRAAAEGLTNKTIARDLGITDRTVKFHFGNICKKLGAYRRGEAVAIARKRGILIE